MYATIDLPGRVLAQAASPGFVQSPPIILAEELIPPDIRAAMAYAWTADYSAPGLIQAIEIQDVYVAGEGLVFDRGFDLLGRSVTQQAPDHVASARRDLVEAVEGGRCPTIEAPLCLCVKPGLRNYGHWLVELLPKVDFALRHLEPDAVSFLVPTAEGRMAEVVDESMMRLGARPASRVGYDGQPVFARTLILVEGLSNHGTFMSPAVLDTFDRLSAGIAAAAETKLYVRREVPAHRQFIDERQIAALFAERGFRAISPEQRSFSEQIALFKGARQVAGIVGAGLTNIGFCRPGAAIDLFYPAGMADTFYWFLSQHRGLDFRDIRCEQVGQTVTSMPWDTDLRIGADRLAGIIEQERGRPSRQSADVLGYHHNDGGIASQKLALLGLLRAARESGRPVRLPSIHRRDQGAEADTAPLFSVFEEGPLRSFLDAMGIAVAAPVPEADASRDFGWEFFHLGAGALQDASADGPPDRDGFACAFFRAVVPKVAAGTLVQSLARQAFERNRIRIGLQLRIERDWIPDRHDNLQPAASRPEDTDITAERIVAKVAHSLGRVGETVLALGDERSLPAGKDEIRRAVRRNAGMRVVWTSDLAAAAALAELKPAELSLIDHELALRAPILVGCTRSAFANIACFERYARSSAPAADLVWNRPEPLLFGRTDFGGSPDPYEATAGSPPARWPRSRMEKVRWRLRERSGWLARTFG